MPEGNKTYVVAVDLGGTKSALALLDENNSIVVRERIATKAHEGPEAVVERLAQVVSDFKQTLPTNAKLATIGICAPGPLDHEAGKLINPTNLPLFYDVPLRDMLEQRLNIPVQLEHDAKAAALGEFYAGAGQGKGSMVYIVIGTGVGAAIIIDGQLYRGQRNFAGEFGHTTLDRYGEPCHCGSRGCFETFMSGPWLARHYERKFGVAGSDHTPDITGKYVVEQAAGGDASALEVITSAGEALGIAVASMAMVLDIECFVVGGSVAKAGDLLLEPARTVLPQYSFQSVSSRVSLVASSLGEDAAQLGLCLSGTAAVWVLSRTKRCLMLRYAFTNSCKYAHKVCNCTITFQYLVRERYFSTNVKAACV